MKKFFGIAAILNGLFFLIIGFSTYFSDFDRYSGSEDAIGMLIISPILIGIFSFLCAYALLKRKDK